MVKPLPQLRAGRNFLDPFVRVESLLFHAAWPETLDQDPPPISARGRLVSALDPDHATKVAGG
jgi:hypothetical protein